MGDGAFDTTIAPDALRVNFFGSRQPDIPVGRPSRFRAVPPAQTLRRNGPSEIGLQLQLQLTRPPGFIRRPNKLTTRRHLPVINFPVGP